MEIDARSAIDAYLVQPALRRPCGPTRVASLLADEVARSGFDSLYPISAVAAV